MSHRQTTVNKISSSFYEFIYIKTAVRHTFLFIYSQILLKSILNKIKIILVMSSLRKNSKTKLEKTSFAVQSDPNDFAQIDANLNSKQKIIKFSTINTFNLTPSADPKQNRKTIEYVQDPEKEQKNKEESSKFRPFRTRKSQLSKVMKLQTNSINFDTNVYNMSISDLAKGESYISTLYGQLQTLRDKIRELQSQQNRINPKTIFRYEEEPSFSGNNFSQDRSRTIQNRRSLCGKIYIRKQSINSERKSSRYSSRQHQDRQDGTDLQNFSREDNTFSNNPSSSFKMSSTYRVKPGKRSQGDINQSIKEQVGKFRPAMRSASLQKRSELQIQQQVKNQLLEQLKPVFFQKEEWEIKDIYDDFRDKMNKKLQIPNGFPMKIPQVTDKLEEYYRISQQIYSVFNVNITKCKEKLIVRRFKNGVYFQLKPNKNIVWYFHGTFYFGEWETDLPSEGQKNGFGFEYVPKKYYYLGQFKEGMRHGRGIIKIINPDDSNSSLCTCYEGQWVRGKPYGYGVQIDQKDNKYMGSFENGDKTGSAKVLNKDGLYYEGQVKNGLKHGYGVEKLVNGDTYIGQFVEGKFQGHGIYKWNNGSTYQGQFLRGKREGRGKWKSYNGDEFDGEYVNDIKHGWGKFTWSNGQMYQGQFKNDIRHGPGTYRHPSGKMGKFMWIDGQIDHRLYSKEEEEYRRRNSNKQVAQ